MKLTTLLLALTLTLASCTQPPPPTVKIAINPWPGYEFLFLAQQKGLYREAGLNIELVPIASLTDAQRAYISGRVDGLASTMIEAVQSQVLSDRPLKIVLLPDYSNGGDVVMAKQPLSAVAELKGKRVGAELSSLGIYMLHRSLASANLTLDDIQLLNLEQSAVLEAFKLDRIDAVVTYPPYSLELEKLGNINTLFTSAQIPKDIIDTLSLAEDAIKANPQLVPGLHAVWRQALDYAAKNPQQAHQIMAARQGITVEEFTATLADIHVVTAFEQQALFKNTAALQEKVLDVCQVLVSVEAILHDCQRLPNLIYQGPL